MASTHDPHIIDSPAQAIALQKQLAVQVMLGDLAIDYRYIAGVDVGYDLTRKLTRCAMVIMDADEQAVIYSSVVVEPTNFPYIPGLLSFREISPMLYALRHAPIRPDLVMVDGHGVAHPRRLGIASHLGVLLDMPTIGVAKKCLCGEYAMPDMTKGSHQPLVHQGEVIGTVLRSRDGVAPLFVSPGHLIGHDAARIQVQRWLGRYRLPEPTRLADRLSKIS